MSIPTTLIQDIFVPTVSRLQLPRLIRMGGYCLDCTGRKRREQNLNLYDLSHSNNKAVELI